ncbi:hypothetical protein BOW86_gp071 [Synechococcus phage S-CAM7]|uniref:Uncharacterized protein n=1 Tax=Synechococcus phage S-CAM7 TaxID=1883368 RepID=A0A1D8KTL0_9CAUD|nr:hypothetical protein BOW86_gp071 [Synechococcus phage S-CAM7]AOV61995.1 hypothetical protein C490910_071 [Synechococcus phage S-CAM7]QLF86126.1 hypothetical protein CC030809_00070 [Synechococcus phage S-CAM7]
MIELFSTVNFTPLEASKAALLALLIGGIVYYAIFFLLQKWISLSVRLESPWSEIVFYVPLIFGAWLAVFSALISK